MNPAPSNRSSVKFLLHASLAAFGTYFCMYAFRKPFTVATFEGLTFAGMDYKIVLIIAQVAGYALSKFMGIKVISELRPNQRLTYLMMLIGMAELALLFFAWTPRPYNIFFMFLNGMPLGMIWGIVFSYLEGRKVTDILGIALCASFIVSSGVVKSVGMFAMQYMGVTEFWMPVVTGAFFLLPLLFFGWLLERVPSPTPNDKASQVERLPMTKEDRKAVLKKFFFSVNLCHCLLHSANSFQGFQGQFC